MNRPNWARTFSENERTMLTRQGFRMVLIATAGAVGVLIVSVIGHIAGTVGEPWHTISTWMTWGGLVAVILMATLGGLAVAIANGLLTGIHRGWERLRSRVRRNR